jgi:hypothetical protein
MLLIYERKGRGEICAFTHGVFLFLSYLKADTLGILQHKIWRLPRNRYSLSHNSQ